MSRVGALGALSASSASSLSTQPDEWDDFDMAIANGISCETRVEAAASSIPASKLFLKTYGFSLLADGGEAFYTKTVASSPGGFQSADGAWWKLAFNNEGVNAKACGAKLDSVTDDTVAIQAAVDNHTYFLGSPRAVLPIGITVTSGPIHAGYTGFRTVRIRGAGLTFNGDLGKPGTQIKPNFSNAPVISAQGARWSILEHFTIKGLNRQWVIDNWLGDSVTPALVDDTMPENWVDPSLHANADSRYAPYAAIAVDPYSGSAPTPAYPSVTYPSYSGTSGQYSKGFSSNVSIRDVEIQGVVVGVVVHPGDSDGNGDFVSVRDSAFNYCQYGISICNTQARNTYFETIIMSRVHTAFTTNVHGRQNGKMGDIVNCHVGEAIQVFNFHSLSIVGPLTFRGLYTESMWRVGDIGPDSSTETSLGFDGCTFGFHLQNQGLRGIPANVFGTGSQSVNVWFNNCVINQFYSVAVFNIQANMVTMRGTTIIPREAPPDLYHKYAQHALCGGLVFDHLGRSIHSLKIFPIFEMFHFDTGATLGSIFMSEIWPGARHRCTPLWSRSHIGLSDHDIVNCGLDAEPVPVRVTSFDMSVLTGVTLVDRTLTFTFPSRADSAFHIYGPLPGDVIFDGVTKSVFYVATRSGLTVTAVLQNNYRSNGAGGFVPITTISLTTGIWSVANSRFYAPEFSMVGDFTSGSPTITNVLRGGGGSPFLETSVLAGDYLFVDQKNDGILSEANSRVVARDGTANTITMAGNATRTSVRKRLGTFIRLPAA